MGITITEDEFDKKIRGTREARKEMVERHKADTNMGEELNFRDLELNRTALRNPDPKKAYHMVNRTKDGENIAKRQGEGYICTPADSDTKWIMSVNKDECQVQGDLVLMETSIENYERRRQLKRHRQAMMEGARVEQAKETMNKIARDGGLSGRHKDAVE